jgi:uncharacterized protein YqgC (DUF456 family)
MIQETEARRTAPAASLWRTLCGWICLAAGVLGVVLPILPGVPLLFAGLILLSSNYQWARKCLHWLKSRFELPTNAIARIRNRKTVHPTP